MADDVFKIKSIMIITYKSSNYNDKSESQKTKVKSYDLDLKAFRLSTYDF